MVTETTANDGTHLNGTNCYPLEKAKLLNCLENRLAMSSIYYLFLLFSLSILLKLSVNWLNSLLESWKQQGIKIYFCSIFDFASFWGESIGLLHSFQKIYIPRAEKSRFDWQKLRREIHLKYPSASGSLKVSLSAYIHWNYVKKALLQSESTFSSWFSMQKYNSVYFMDYYNLIANGEWFKNRIL